MIYRSIMVQLDPYDPIEAKVRFAWQLAGRFEADLIGLAACDIPIAPMVFATGAVVDTELMARQNEEIEKRLATVKEEFMALAKDSSRASWRGAVGNANHFLARQARAADLIVVGPSHDGPGSVEVGEAALAAGRPLLLPAGDMKPLQASRVVIAWKDAREARRAVVDALPFMSDADEVLVVSVDEDGSARDGLSDIVRYLIKHGVKARAQLVAAGEGTVGEIVVSRALEIGADLVVSGAFGHSRLREWILGGATRSLIADQRLHRFLSN